MFQAQRAAWPAIATVAIAIVLSGQGCYDRKVDELFPPAPSDTGRKAAIDAELGGGAVTRRQPSQPFDIDDVADFRIAIDLEPTREACEKLPEERQKEEERYSELMNLQIADFSYSVAAVAEAAKKCQTDEIILPSGPCADEWSRVQDAYRAAFLDTLFGKRNAASDKEYADAKAAFEACQKGQRSQQASCVDQRKQTAAQAQNSYASTVAQTDTVHKENVAKLDQFEKKCFELALSGRLSLPADVTVGTPAVPAVPAVPTAPAVPAEPAAPASTVQSFGKYYVVTSTDPKRDTGNEVCASVGKTCVGYTAFNVDVCRHFHPGAIPTFGLDGSKAGFYCDGAPQGGICGKLANSCAICEACNVNADCAMEIGVLYREMYVECK